MFSESPGACGDRSRGHARPQHGGLLRHLQRPKGRLGGGHRPGELTLLHYLLSREKNAFEKQWYRPLIRYGRMMHDIPSADFYTSYFLLHVYQPRVLTVLVRVGLSAGFDNGR